MKLNARQDVDLPIATVYARLTDFDGWQKAALRRGAMVARTDRMSHPAAGMSWSASFAYRGKPRQLDLSLDQIVPPERLAFSGSGPNLTGTVAIDLVEMAPQRTRVMVKLEIKPRTLVARLFIQSLKLGRSSVEDKFRARVAQVLAEIERPGQAPRRGSAG
jgi:carbon monoxide dehydrogenase subunit G